MGKIIDLETQTINSIIDFFESYPRPKDAKQALWELLMAAMGSQHADMWNGEARVGMLYFYEQCGNFFDAVYANILPQFPGND